jgi:hypothetical protein
MTSITWDRIKQVRQGQRYRATRPLELGCSLFWDAPFSGGEYVTFPEGEVLVVQHDPYPGSSAVNCIPEKYEELKPILLKEYLHEGFTSYSLCVFYGVLFDECELLPSRAYSLLKP